MNPFLYKAHPLLSRLVELLLDPSAHSLDEASQLALIFLALTPLWTLVLLWVIRRGLGFRPSIIVGYALAFPACLLYLPLWLTLLGDVLDHAFRLEDRYLFIFAIVVVAQMLGAFYGIAIRYDRTGRPIGLKAGITVSLALLLASIPFGLGLLGLNHWFRVV
jgi:hypothetical protein